MTKPLIALPCTARELEDALHRVCDHAGLWDKRICFGAEGRKFALCLQFETETKEGVK